MLFRAIKHQVDKGPVDAVTGKAKYTLNDNRLLREDVEYRTLVRHTHYDIMIMMQKLSSYWSAMHLDFYEKGWYFTVSLFVFLLSFIVFNLITHSHTTCNMTTAFQLLSMLFCRLWMFWWAAEVLVSLRRSPLKCWIVTPSHRWRRRFWSRHGRARHTSRDPPQTLCIWVRAWYNV